MLNFTQTFDIQDELKLLLNESNGNYDDAAVSNIKVLGQERGGAILFSWVQGVQLNEQLTPHTSMQERVQVTNIGLYDSYSKSHKLLYTYDNKVTMANATVNEDHNFIGFVIQETVTCTGAANVPKKQDVYKAYLAEIQPQNRTFYLNLEKPHYIRLQFLYGAYRGYNAREAHLIVFLHRESIGLYHLPMARTGDGVIMSQEPRKEQLFHHRFVWSQWDPTEQRLYIVYFKRESSKPFLVTYQFSPAIPKMAAFMMEFELGFPIPRPSSNSHSRYATLSPSHIVQDTTTNLAVLTHNNGTVCVCYQHPVDKTKETVNLMYTVSLLHHGHNLHCTCYNIPPGAQTAKLLFSWIGSHLCVQLAGCFVHLLNVDAEYEPGHHVLWHDNTSSLPAGQNISGMVNLLRDKQPSSAHGCAVFGDNRGYSMSVNTELLSAWFMENKDPSTRLAILHYSLIHSRDIALFKQLCSSLCENEASMNMTTYFKEALVGIAYCRARRQIEQDELRRCLPYTVMDSYRGQVMKDGSEPQVSIRYDPISGPPKLGQSQHQGDMWTALIARTKHKAPANTTSRLYNEDVAQDIREMDVKSFDANTQKTSLFRRLTSRFGNAAETNAESASSSVPVRVPSRNELGKLPDFLRDTEHPIPYRQQKVELISNHMSSYLTTSGQEKPGKFKLNNIADEYVQCQLYATRFLCHVLWNVIGSSSTSFLVLERYLLATTDLGFPCPQPFVPFLTELAFKTLPLRTFLPYVDNGILVLTPDFVNQVIKDLDDSGQNVAIKQQLISRLPKGLAIECLQHWSHPLALRFTARLHAAAVWNKTGYMSSLAPGSPTSMSEHVQHHHNVPPLNSLLGLLKQMDNGVETDLIEKAAFLDMN